MKSVLRIATVAVLLLAVSCSTHDRPPPIDATSGLFREAQRAEVSQAPLRIHGPFKLSTEAVRRLVDGHDASARRVGPINDEGSAAEPYRGLTGGCDQLTDWTSSETRPLNAPSVAPPVTTGSGTPSDPQIAVGTKDVVVTLRQTFLFFDKAQLLAQSPNGTVSATPVAAEAFFAPITPDINAHLSLPVGYQVRDGYGLDPSSFPGNTYYDARTIYDPYRKRFWIVALAVNQKAAPKTAAAKADPIHQSTRRTKIVVAVSATDDALGDWYLYWWDGNHNEDNDPRVVQGKYFSRVDYPLLGISEKYLLVENKAGFCPTSTTGGGPCDYDGKEDLDYNFVTVAAADALASGALPQGAFDAQEFWNFRDPNHKVIASDNYLAPAMHHGRAGVSYFANNFSDAGQSYLLAWFLTDKAGGLQFYRFLVSIRPLVAIRKPSGAINVAFRGRHVVAVVNEMISCGVTGEARAVRVIRVDVFTGKATLDRSVGGRSQGDPPWGPDRPIYYQPAVTINHKEDIAMTFLRMSDKLPLEARYSVIYAGSDAQPPSALLQVGQTKPGGPFDTAGISLDPNDYAVWFAQPYSASSGPRLAIGRIWGP